MYKQIQAFFASEDDAETVKAQLNKLKTNDLLVDEIKDDDQRTLLLAPLAFSGNRTSGSHAGGAFIPAMVSGGNSEDNPEWEDNEARTYTLEGEVEEEDYHAALEIIKDGDGYVDKNFFDKQN